MPLKFLIVAMVTLTVAACSGVGPGLNGNDTGGIIPWSPEHQKVARAWASEHCARYHKRARITSIRARYGDYIGFTCQYDHKRPAG